MLSIQLDILYKFYENNFLEVALTFSKIFHFCFPFSAHHLVRRDCISAIEINYFMVDQVCMSGTFCNCCETSQKLYRGFFVQFSESNRRGFLCFCNRHQCNSAIAIVVPKSTMIVPLIWTFVNFVISS